MIDPIKILRWGNKGIVIANRCAKDKTKYHIGGHEYFGLPKTLTVHAMAEIQDRYKLRFWCECKERGHRISKNVNELDLSKKLAGKDSTKLDKNS